MNSPLPRAWTAAIVAVLFAGFLVANRGAYRGYFSADDLDNLVWTTRLPASAFAKALWSPVYHSDHFRPIGHGTFALLGHTAGMDFRWYVALVHVLHFAAAFVLWRVLRRLPLPELAAAAGATFFLYQIALFPALWRPMYVFDVWCALFCLLTLHGWIADRPWLALGCFWLALKSKEHATAMVAVLVAYDWLVADRRRWRWITAFAAMALLFAAQAALANRGAPESEYTLRFDLVTLAQTVSFYTARALIVPWLGLALLAGPLLIRSRVGHFGLAAFWLLLAPMLILPGRLFAAYLYAPMFGVAVWIAAALGRRRWPATAAFFALWLPLCYWHLRRERRAELTIADENRAYTNQVFELARSMPDLRRFVHDGRPAGLPPWGIQGALRLAYATLDLEVCSSADSTVRTLFDAGPTGVLQWVNAERKVRVTRRAPGDPDLPYLDHARFLPPWQLEDGWFASEQTFRWSKPHAVARLHRPAGAREFEVRVNAGPSFIAEVKRATLRVRIDGEDVGTAVFDQAGWRAARWSVAAKPAGPARVEFLVDPPFRPAGGDPRTLGLPIGAFGFVTGETQ